MRTVVTEGIRPENVREVGFLDAPDVGSMGGVATTFLEADFQGFVIKGMQVGSYVMWWMPEEFEPIAKFFLGAQDT